MSADAIIKLWKDARNGLIQEVEKIPDDQMSFRATPETRTIAETCREDSNIRRQSFADHTKEYAPGVRDVTDKQGIIDLLRSSMETAEGCIRSFGEKLDEPMSSIDGSQSTKGAVLTFAFSHEMYHRGQLTVFERLLNIEPVLTGKLKKLFAASGSSD
jgi:hypothetical protein